MINENSRFFPHSIRNYFATYDNKQKIAELGKGLNPYDAYELNYRIYCFWGFSKYSPNPDEENTFFGTIDFKKSIENDKSVYNVERRIQGALNRKNEAQPVSITKYYQTCKNDMLCSVSPEDSMGYEYYTQRKYYNNDTMEVYHNKQNIYIDANNTLFIRKNGNATELGTTANKLLTNFSLIDALQKAVISDKKQNINLKFDLLENMEILKTNLTISYIESIKLNIGSNEIILNGYHLNGAGKMPTFYWATDSGVLLVVNQGITYTLFA